MMNNEEKILSMLENLTERVDTIAVEQASMRDTLTRVAVTQENVVLPQLKLLAEGHTTLLQTLAPKSRVEELEEEMATLKSVIRVLSDRVNALADSIGA